MGDVEVTYIAAATTTEVGHHLSLPRSLPVLTINAVVQTGTTIEIIDCDARKIVHVINDESITTANHGTVRRVIS
jgi:hypothetical protein